MAARVTFKEFKVTDLDKLYGRDNISPETTRSSGWLISNGIEVKKGIYDARMGIITKNPNRDTILDIEYIVENSLELFNHLDIWKVLSGESVST